MDDQQRADLRSFGLRVQELRAERGWTQEQAAATCAVDRSYLASLEAGKRNVGVAVVYRLARGFGVEPSALLTPPSGREPHPGRSRSGA